MLVEEGGRSCNTRWEINQSFNAQRSYICKSLHKVAAGCPAGFAEPRQNRTCGHAFSVYVAVKTVMFDVFPVGFPVLVLREHSPAGLDQVCQKSSLLLFTQTWLLLLIMLRPPCIKPKVFYRVLPRFLIGHEDQKQQTGRFGLCSDHRNLRRPRDRGLQETGTKNSRSKMAKVPGGHLK